jgi:uncharacterized protein involved in exopolysaccharide biosynthesis
MKDIQESSKMNNLVAEEPEFILGDLWKELFAKLIKLKSQMPRILLTGVVFALLGAALVWIKNSTYTGRVNFVIEESKQNSAGLFGALAGQIGLDMSSLSGNSGILAGDNVLELLKSPTLLKKVLLSPNPDDTSTSLALAYATAYGYEPSFIKAIGEKNIFKPRTPITFALTANRIEDSLLHIISKRILEKELSVFKPDKKLSIFSLELTTRNEKLSQLISLRLIDQAANLYVETKTRRLRINVDRLQRKADSVAYLLNSQTLSSASKDLINANPTYINTGVDLEISNRDKALLGGIYSDLNKSLDISKTALIQETPTIEIIDKPELPLKKNEWKWYLIVPLSFIVGILFSSMILLFFVPLGRSSNK